MQHGQRTCCDRTFTGFLVMCLRGVDLGSGPVHVRFEGSDKGLRPGFRGMSGRLWLIETSERDGTCYRSSEAIGAAVFSVEGDFPACP